MQAEERHGRRNLRAQPCWSIAVICLLCCGAGSARTLIVGDNGPFATIRDAIAAANQGDIVEVHGGRYDGDLVLDRTVTLIGIDRPRIRGSGQRSVVTVIADSCTIRGFIIERSGTMLVDEHAGVLLRSSHNRIQKNELRDVLYGVYLLASNDNEIAGNVIEGRALPDLGSRGSGIHIWNSSRNLIADNTITGARDGMYLQNAYHSMIRGNRIYGLRYGLHYMFSDDNTFEDNISYDNVAGAAIMYSKRIQFRRNAFLHNRGFSSFGILFQDTENCLAEGNVISDNAVGIFMESLRNSTLRRNLISANDLALQIFQSASNNVFESNNFVENLSPIEVIGGRTTIQWHGSSAGNYWSDYDGFDLDGDGIGDVPHRIYNAFAALEGNFPRLRIYLYSPSAQALALAERGFPVLRRESEQDEKPLIRPAALVFQAPDVKNRGRRSVAAFIPPCFMLVVFFLAFRVGVQQ